LRSSDLAWQAVVKARLGLLVRLSSNLREVSIGVSGVRVGSVLEKELHDLLLLGARPFRAARARRMRDDVERRRALPAVSRIHASAALEETANGLGTPCANRAMQWSRARFILVLDVRPGVEKALNHRPLFGRVPGLSRLGSRVARVMESRCSTPILGVRVSSGCDQRLDGERPERRSREVERRISDV